MRTIASQSDSSVAACHLLERLGIGGLGVERAFVGVERPPWVVRF
jgi:hypothetical protein